MPSQLCLAVILVLLMFLAGCGDSQTTSQSSGASVVTKTPEIQSEASRDDGNSEPTVTDADPEPPHHTSDLENDAIATDREDTGPRIFQHSKSVLAMKIGDKQYRPGSIFEIAPANDAVIKGDCRLKFKCIRKTGDSDTPYGMCTVIFAKLETGEEEVSMGRQYNTRKADDGSISVASTYAWPAAQNEAELEFSVELGTERAFAGTTKYSGKGNVYFYLDDGEDTPLSNIIAIEADIPR